MCFIHSSAANSISTLLSPPLTTLITYYTSVFSLCDSLFPPLLQVLFFFSSSHQVLAKWVSVVFIVPNCKMVVVLEVSLWREKEANDMCGEERWRKARREV